MSQTRVTVSWLVFSILILISAKLFIDSNGESIYSWAILLMIPIPLSIIISFQSNEKKLRNNDVKDLIKENEDFNEMEKRAEDPLEIGFDIPIL
ncbi:MAG: hypothetical protein CMA53_00635 [Euryarchaeota archaeon]|nr:hypothetical protein [Euryarchaeota archaeon]|tara:strand:+ start:2613 stop:2894 length:282 start_codon:yes stop_codon:yes gene_type:complete